MLRHIEVGARMMGMGLHPHQLDLGDLLDSSTETTAICWPRRAGKTTSTWAWMLGRCETIPGTQWITTAQSGIKARDRFMAVTRLLERHYPEDDGGPHIFRGAGHEAFEWANGSRLSVVSPKGESFRGDGAHVYIDEPQEFDPVKSDDLKQGVMPLLDTLDAGQVVLSGTAGRLRAGWFWGALEAGRKGLPGFALSEHAAPDLADPNSDEVLLAAHPGIGTLTTLEKMQARRAGMPTPMWAQEYLGIWPPDSSQSALDLALWNRADVPQEPLPDRFGLAFEVAADTSSAALVAAWRDEQGVGRLGVLEYRQGASWLPSVVAQVARKYRMPVRYDAIGANHGIAASLERQRVSLERSPAKDVQAAEQLVALNLSDGLLVHFGQASLTAAVEGSSWYQTESGRYLARRPGVADISTLKAGALALYQFDRMPASRSIRIRTSASVA